MLRGHKVPPPTLRPATRDIPSLLPKSLGGRGNPCCGDTLKCGSTRSWVLSRSGHRFCSLLGSCVKKKKKNDQPTKKKPHKSVSASVPQAQRDGIRVVGNTDCFCRGKGSIHTLTEANFQLAACLNFPQSCSSQALGCYICSEMAVMKSTFLPRERPELPSMCSQHLISRLPGGASQRSCLRNFFERAGLQLVLFRWYF